MKKILTLVSLMMLLIPLRLTQAQIFPDCDFNSIFSHTVSGWFPQPYFWMRGASCTFTETNIPGDQFEATNTDIHWGSFITYTFVFPYDREILWEVWKGNIKIWDNVPPGELPDTHVVEITFSGGFIFDLIIDSNTTASWPPGSDYELRASLTAFPEFELVLPFIMDSPVPVELMTFTASLVSQTGLQEVFLAWATATEINNYGWHIERSYDQVDWQRIGWQDGSGNSNSPKTYSYRDRTAQGLVAYYRLQQIDTDGASEYSPIVEVQGKVEAFTLLQNYPNPFNPTTNISYALPDQCYVDLRVYNTLGQEVAMLVNGEQLPGVYTVSFNADNLSSGMYIYELRVGEYAERKKMTLLK